MVALASEAFFLSMFLERLTRGGPNHHQIPMEIVAAFKRGFADRRESIALVKADAARVLIVDGESDRAIQCGERGRHQLLRRAGAVIRRQYIAPGQFRDAVCERHVQHVRTMSQHAETDDIPAIVHDAHIEVAVRENRFEARRREILVDIFSKLEFGRIRGTGECECLDRHCADGVCVGLRSCTNVHGLNPSITPMV
ncbi:hypothetical protein PT2222_30077 [Paraburkholderia tropica]